MTTSLFIKKKEILLFAPSREQAYSCQLKNFIHCLNLFETKRPLNFAYAEAETLMMNHLSLKENIFLDGFLNSLCESKEFQLERHLSHKGRPWLVKLFAQIGNLELSPKDVSPETRKLASLFKTLLRPADYIFLERPEQHLSEENFALFINALKEQIENEEQTIFINSLNEEIWLPHVSKKIIKNDEGLIKVLLPSSFKKSSEPKAA